MEERNAMPTLAQSFTTSDGDGTHNNVRNSSLQNPGIVSSKEKMREAISTMLDVRNPHFSRNIFRIADFGCSVGPNTFDVVQNIIDTVTLKYQEDNNFSSFKEDLEFHVFFNDQTNNDFNTLFKNLPGNGKYFVAGVPGSFYGRVFPRNSLHIGHTSYSLHWLSKAPEHACKGSYKEQFERGMGAFLEARAEEIVSGGLMILLVLCVPDSDPEAKTFSDFLTGVFLDSVDETTKSGITDEEKARLFSVPVYYPRVSEMEEVMERNGRFSIEMGEEIKPPIADVYTSRDLIVCFFRGLYHGVIEEHFGDKVWANEIFDSFAKKLDECNIDDFKKHFKQTHHFIVLKAK